jgi:hypothetical protein
MAQAELLECIEKRLKSARQSAESGTNIIDREHFVDPQSMRTAADQFRQAAKELDQIDGMYQALYQMELK